MVCELQASFDTLGDRGHVGKGVGDFVDKVLGDVDGLVDSGERFLDLAKNEDHLNTSDKQEDGDNGDDDDKKDCKWFHINSVSCL